MTSLKIKQLDYRHLWFFFFIIEFRSSVFDGCYLSMMTGSEGVSFLLPQLFLSQHRLVNRLKTIESNPEFGKMVFLPAHDFVSE